LARPAAIRATSACTPVGSASIPGPSGPPSRTSPSPGSSPDGAGRWPVGRRAL